MAKMKPEGTVKVTFEVDDRIITCTSPRLAIGKDSWGGWEDMTIFNPYDVQITPKKEEAPVPPEESNTEEPALTHEQKMGLARIIQTAKQLERQPLVNARAVQAAILEGQKLTAEVEHKFNLSVLEALHTGLTQEAIELHLFTAGFSQLEERVDSVHTLDTGLLYEAAE